MSIFEVQVGNKAFRIDSSKSYDLSIPLRFKGARLNAFGIGPAESQAVENERFVGDTHKGGSCNVQQYTLVPHCQGTHTECVGHVVDQDVSIAEILKEAWIPATVLSLTLERGLECADSYVPDKDAQDAVVSKNNLKRRLDEFDDEHFHSALIIRTLPNLASKKTAQYTTAPYLSNDAMDELTRRPVKHLLVDLPSVDRMDDQGRLSNHRIFWGLGTMNNDLGERQPSPKTITELIYVPDQVKDGYYLLNLQIPAFMADAAPSRPLVFPAAAQ